MWLLWTIAAARADGIVWAEVDVRDPDGTRTRLEVPYDWISSGDLAQYQPVADGLRVGGHRRVERVKDADGKRVVRLERRRDDVRVPASALRVVCATDGGHFDVALPLSLADGLSSLLGGASIDDRPVTDRLDGLDLGRVVGSLDHMAPFALLRIDGPSGTFRLATE